MKVSLKKKFSSRKKKLIKSINNKFRYDFSITISDEGKGIKEFVSLYKDVLSYHNHKFYDGDNSIEDMKSLKNLIDYLKNIILWGYHYTRCFRTRFY